MADPMLTAILLALAITNALLAWALVRLQRIEAQVTRKQSYSWSVLTPKGEGPSPESDASNPLPSGSPAGTRAESPSSQSGTGQGRQ